MIVSYSQKEEEFQTYGYIIHLESCDDSVVGFYERANHIFVLYELNIRTQINGNRAVLSWAMTNLNITNDGFPLLLEHCQTLLYSYILLQSLVLFINPLLGIVNADQGGGRCGRKELTVMALTRLFVDCVALAIWVRIFGLS